MQAKQYNMDSIILKSESQIIMVQYLSNSHLIYNHGKITNNSCC